MDVWLYATAVSPAKGVNQKLVVSIHFLSLGRSMRFENIALHFALAHIWTRPFSHYVVWKFVIARSFFLMSLAG